MKQQLSEVNILILKYVDGKVFSFIFNSKIIISAIYANVVGRGYCRMYTYSGSNKHRTRTNDTKEEIYFNRKIYYVGGGKNSSGMNG